MDVEELEKFLLTQYVNSNKELAKAILEKYDLEAKSEPPLMKLANGDVFKRVNGGDTIVWRNERYSQVPGGAFFGVNISEPLFTTYGHNTDEWVLVLRYGDPEYWDESFNIVLDRTGKRVG